MQCVIFLDETKLSVVRLPKQFKQDTNSGSKVVMLIQMSVILCKWFIIVCHVYTTLNNFSTIYLVMCKLYSVVGSIKQLYHVCTPIRKIIHSLKLMDYLHVRRTTHSITITLLMAAMVTKMLNTKRHFCFTILSKNTDVVE